MVFVLAVACLMGLCARVDTIEGGLGHGFVQRVTVG